MMLVAKKNVDEFNRNSIENISPQQNSSDSFDLFVRIAYFCGSEQAEASAAHYFVGKILCEKRHASFLFLKT